MEIYDAYNRDLPEGIQRNPRGGHMSKADEPAFPVEYGNSTAMNGTILGPGQMKGGLTKREYFIGLAMQGMLSLGPIPGQTDISIEGQVQHAVRLANALLAELEKE